MKLKGKKIILGITGSIAAYKSAILTRLLIKEGAIVKVIMTPYAKEFITPVTLATLSHNTVLSDFFSHDDGAWNSHVELGIWADLMLIAPATANTIAKMANGICDNLLLTSYLSVRCPVIIAPAMDMDMFKHPSTKKNLKTLQEYKNIIIEPSSGELASGLHGKGRMEEPEKIVTHLIDFFQSKKKIIDLSADRQDKKFLVTAGPTYENIDPVRFIGNHSSGKMGFAIAEELANNGAEVILITGPTNLNLENNSIKRIDVTSAEEMYKATMSKFNDVDCAILSAAVADYTPVNTNKNKIKKSSGNYTIELKATIDIASKLGKIKKKNQFLVGFALETDNEINNAKLKLRNKNLDIIILNSLKDSGAGFKHDTNKITIIDKNNKIVKYKLKHKKEVASDIVNKILEMI
ncbi:MAG: bifunctional phosphopantothenoylcysteine decarboxylase/phosphopantothenate--cysteine ligase CoaBC [Bacteroidales bacterium]|nr:bifunctional phosphopantothenoylcysteine decarboxylase/phosphopantothenate--cysteine ligase CoaBC [Bacteroidales bacterium]